MQMYKAAIIGLGRIASTYDDEKTRGGMVYFLMLMLLLIPTHHIQN